VRVDRTLNRVTNHRDGSTTTQSYASVYRSRGEDVRATVTISSVARRCVSERAKILAQKRRKDAVLTYMLPVISTVHMVVNWTTDLVVKCANVNLLMNLKKKIHLIFHVRQSTATLSVLGASRKTEMDAKHVNAWS